MGRANVRIRPAEPADVPDLVDLAAASDIVLVPGGNRQMQLDALAQLPERLLELMGESTRRLLVAVADDAVVPDTGEDLHAAGSVGGSAAAGSIVGMALVCEDRMSDLVPTSVVRLAALAVRSSHRRRGVGRALLAAVVHIADERSVEHVSVGVASRSRDANRYLARLGFAPMITRRVAPISVLRRSLGLADGPDRMAVRRRVMIARSPRTVVNGRALRRGA